MRKYSDKRGDVWVIGDYLFLFVTFLPYSCDKPHTNVWNYRSKCITNYKLLPELILNYTETIVANVLQFYIKKGKRTVHGVPQSQAAALPNTKRKRKQTQPNKRKANKSTKSTKINSLFPKRGNRNAQRTEKHKYKITLGKT